MDFITIIGTTGATTLLIAFILNQLHKWKEDYLVYDLFNTIGGSLLITYALMLESWPFVILNLVWATLSFRDLILDTKRNSKRDSKNFTSKWLK